MKTSHVIIIIITLAIWFYNVRVWVAYSKILDKQLEEKKNFNVEPGIPYFEE